MSSRTTRNWDQPVAQAWASYLDKVLPVSAGANQRLETRRAFYAGALAALSAGKDEAARSRMLGECIDFNAEVVKGRA